MKELDIFLTKNYPKLTIDSGLFYEWQHGLRFELGVSHSDLPAYLDVEYLQTAKQRARELFFSVHDKSDQLIMICDVYTYRGHVRKPRAFRPYVKNVNSLKEIHYQLSEMEDDPNVHQHRFILPCTYDEIYIEKLINSICNADMGKKPSTPNNYFIVNLTKETMFHVYDDRGCDLIASKKEKINQQYIRYNSWILDYDREEIDKTFTGK